MKKRAPNGTSATRLFASSHQHSNPFFLLWLPVLPLAVAANSSPLLWRLWELSAVLQPCTDWCLPHLKAVTVKSQSAALQADQEQWPSERSHIKSGAITNLVSKERPILKIHTLHSPLDRRRDLFSSLARQQEFSIGARRYKTIVPSPGCKVNDLDKCVGRRQRWIRSGT